jgi:hypothetical protein
MWVRGCNPARLTVHVSDNVVIIPLHDGYTAIKHYALCCYVLNFETKKKRKPYKYST